MLRVKYYYTKGKEKKQKYFIIKFFLIFKVYKIK